VGENDRVLLLLESDDFFLQGTHRLTLAQPGDRLNGQPAACPAKILLCPEAGMSYGTTLSPRVCGWDVIVGRVA
jgi:hypothetical protein